MKNTHPSVISFLEFAAREILDPDGVVTITVNGSWGGGLVTINMISHVDAISVDPGIITITQEEWREYLAKEMEIKR